MIQDNFSSQAATAFVLFDAECAACVNLARFAARRTTDTAFLSWQDFKNSSVAQRHLPTMILSRPANSLRVWTGSTLLEGADAWSFLLEKNQELASLSWLASQLGLQRIAARSLHGAGNIMRRFCWRCPRA